MRHRSPGGAADTSAPAREITHRGAGLIYEPKWGCQWAQLPLPSRPALRRETPVRDNAAHPPGERWSASEVEHHTKFCRASRRAFFIDANANIGISIPPMTHERSPGPEAGGNCRPLHPQSSDPRRTPALAHQLAVDPILDA
jgi:hypothetical protein